MAYRHPMLSTQKKIEQDMAKATSDKFYADLEAARKDGTMETTKPGRHIVAATVGEVADRLRQMIDKPGRGQPRTGIVLMRKHEIEPEVGAFLAIRQIVNLSMLTDDGFPSLAVVAAKIGNAVHQDMQFKRFGAEHADSMKQLQKQWEKRGTSNSATMKAQLRAKAKHEAFEFDALSSTDAVSIGSLILEVTTEAGLTEYVQSADAASSRKREQVYSLAPSRQFMDWMDDLTVRAELLQPRYWPMVCPPRPWIDGWSGGYRTNAVQQLPMIKRPSKGQALALQEADGIQPVCDALNAMQDTPWAVNAEVLAVYQWALSRADGIAGLPAAEDAPKPPKPADFDARMAADPADPEVKAWKRKAAMVHESNAKLRSKRLQALAVQRMAEQFERFESIYFPYNLDFRGRAYAVPMHLQPQGADHAKALLKFSKGERMGDSDTAGYWLAVHGANVYGEDKAAMDDRALWANLHTDQIVATAADPYDNLDFWTEADKPWQFLAFCFEWAGYQDQGADFVTTLPVAMDGSCNGLQHYSAAIRDQVGGAEVNLVPGDKPADIYSTVAEGMKAQLAQIEAPSVDGGSRLDEFPIDPDTGLVGPLDSEQTTAYVTAQLKGFKIDRKLAKRTVMTVPYGVTEFGAYAQLEESIGDALGDQASPFKHLHKWDDGKTTENNGVWAASRVLAPLLMESIGEALAGAQECMDFVKDAVKVANDAQVATTWTTPDGFPVVQNYKALTDERVRTVIHGSTSQIRVHNETDKLNGRKAKTAAPPNFVHSLDATAMRMYVTRAKAEGVKHFAMVHDSFGTVATRVQDMNRLIREAFVGMYAEHDVLAEFRDSIAKVVPPESQGELPIVPDQGTLDLQDVLKSVYFFS